MSEDIPNSPLPPPPPPGSIVASALASQLGTDGIDLQRGMRADMRRLSNIEANEIPFYLYAKIRSRKSNVWGVLYDELLNLRVSVGGRGRRDIIRMEQVSHGGGVDVNAELEATRPGWWERNISRRNWREETLRDGPP